MYCHHRFASCLLFLLMLQVTAAIIPAETLTERLDALIDGHPASERTLLALRVVDLQTREVLYDRNGRKLFTPASNLKIYTSACALDLLGGDHRFQTRVLLDGKLQDGILEGNLVLVGGGDPMLKTEDLRIIARRLKSEYGLRQVTGYLMVDDSCFGVPRKGPGWMWDDDPDPYNATIAGIMLNFNVIDVVVEPGSRPGAGARVAYDPLSSFPPRLNDSLTTPSQNTISVTRNVYQDSVRISGTIPSDAERAVYSINVYTPARWIAGVFQQILAEEDIRIRSYLQAQAPTTADRELVHDSVPVRDAVFHFNKTSENAVGEMLLHQLVINSGERPTDWSQGAGIISRWLVETAGLEEGSFRLVDGSGLSRYDLISASSSTDLLSFMWTHPEKKAFFDSLPVYKVGLPEGSTADPERVHAKPGGMSGVSTISGYIETLDGRWLAFSCLANGYIGSNEPVLDLRSKVWSELVKGTGE